MESQEYRHLWLLFDKLQHDQATTTARLNELEKLLKQRLELETEKTKNGSL